MAEPGITILSFPILAWSSGINTRFDRMSSKPPMPMTVALQVLVIADTGADDLAGTDMTLQRVAVLEVVVDEPRIVLTPKT